LSRGSDVDDKPAPIKDPESGRFVPGNNGGTGRPKGSRNKLGEDFIAALHNDFTEHGVSVIQRVREERPQDYMKVVASLLPKDVNLNVNPAEDLTDEQLIQRIRSLGAAIRPFLDAEGAGDLVGGVAAPTLN